MDRISGASTVDTVAEDIAYSCVTSNDPKLVSQFSQYVVPASMSETLMTLAYDEYGDVMLSRKNEGMFRVVWQRCPA